MDHPMLRNSNAPSFYFCKAWQRNQHDGGTFITQYSIRTFHEISSLRRATCAVVDEWLYNDPGFYMNVACALTHPMVRVVVSLVTGCGVVGMILASQRYHRIHDEIFRGPDVELAGPNFDLVCTTSRIFHVVHLHVPLSLRSERVHRFHIGRMDINKASSKEK